MRKLREEGLQVKIASPKVVFGRYNPTNKWLGYLDKLILFPGS